MHYECDIFFNNLVPKPYLRSETAVICSFNTPCPNYCYEKM